MMNVFNSVLLNHSISVGWWCVNGIPEAWVLLHDLDGIRSEILKIILREICIDLVHIFGVVDKLFVLLWCLLNLLNLLNLLLLLLGLLLLLLLGLLMVFVLLTMLFWLLLRSIINLNIMTVVILVTNRLGYSGCSVSV